MVAKKDPVKGAKAKGQPKGGPGRYARAETEERRRRLRKLLSENPVHHLRVPQLAEFFEVSERTIYSDLASMREEVPREVVENIALNVVGTLDRIRVEVDALATKAKNENVRLGATRLRLDTVKETLTILERMGWLELERSSDAPQVEVVLGFDPSGYPGLAPKGAPKGRRRRRAAAPSEGEADGS